MDVVLPVLAVATGVALLTFATLDVLRTTLAPSAGGGPLTRHLSHAVWRAALALSSGPRSRLLSSVGPLTLMVTIGTWVLLLWSGWTLLFAGNADGIIRSSTGEPVDVWGLVYFTGFTLFTLGVGDVVPMTPAWQVLTPVASLHGLFLVTLSVTYLVPIVSAAVERRQQATSVWVMGGNASSIVSSGWHLGSFEGLERDLQSMVPELLRTAERHPSYPTLNYFHTGEIRSDFRTRIAALDDTVSLLHRAVAPGVRPSPSTLQSIHRVIDDLLEAIGHGRLEHDEDVPPIPDLAPLARAGIPLVPEHEIAAAFAALAGRRRRLSSAVTEVGWRWDAVESGPSA